MDPLTHTLVGASLSATRLGETTRRAVPALVIGANLPDVDVFAMFVSDDAALGFRRGWTHGVLALVVLPALLALILWGWERLRSRGEPQGFSLGWLFALSYLAVLTHPALDWLNTYGIRLLMPFDDTWFYGDSVFIIDPWLWIVLGAGWLIGRRPRLGLLITWGAVSALLLLMAALRAPSYIPAVAVALLVLLLALSWRPVEPKAARVAATAGLVLATLFIGSLITLHAIAEERIRGELDRKGVGSPDQLMVGPLPLNPFTWEFVVSADGRLRHGELSFLGNRGPETSGFDAVDARATDLWSAIEASGQARGFLGWARFPWVAAADNVPRSSVQVLDARYTRDVVSGFGSALVELPDEMPSR